ncbi:MAG: DNA-binding response OmpR family regulator [Verrucomicrobiales bacterium]|jgi:DNA-binding response OmpR family regulator
MNSPTRVLLIDDNLNLTSLLSRALSKFGLTPFVENNSFLSMDAIRRHKPDLLVLDVMMPGKDGAAVLAELRMDKEWGSLPVILLTALAQEAQSIANIGGRQCSVMGKPVELADLVENINAQVKLAA